MRNLSKIYENLHNETICLLGWDSPHYSTYVCMRSPDINNNGACVETDRHSTQS